MNLVLTRSLPAWYGESFDFAAIGLPKFPAVKVAGVVSIWSIELALLAGIAATFAIGYARIMPAVKSGLTHAVGGALPAAMGNQYLEAAQAAGISPEVLHRVASMASGGMDTLPHNGAVITLLAITGLTHRQSYRDIFAVTLIKTAAVFLVIGFYVLTGLV